MRNKRSGTQDEKCIWQNISHMCLILYSGCRFIVTKLHLKVLHFDILIQLKGTDHSLEIILGLIQAFFTFFYSASKWISPIVEFRKKSLSLEGKSLSLG